MLGQPLVDRTKERIGPMMTAGDLLLRLGPQSRHEQPLVRAVVVELVEHIIDLAVGYAQAEMIAGGRLQVVRLVEDHDVVIRQDARLLPPQRQVAEKQRVVHDQYLRVLHSPPRLEIKALRVLRAFSPHAVTAVAGHFIPDLRQWLKRQIGPRAVVRLFCPLGQLAQLGEFAFV
jgi:hypothetical protein